MGVVLAKWVPMFLLNFEFRPDLLDGIYVGSFYPVLEDQS